jgi:hypothetical protein
MNEEKKEHQFKVGDKVRIHKPADVEDGPVWIEQMDKFDGTEQVLESVGSVGNWYCVDSCGYCFHPDWLELVVPEQEKPTTHELYFALEQINNALGVNRNKYVWQFMHFEKSDSLSIKITDTEEAFELMELARSLFEHEKLQNYCKGTDGNGILSFNIYYGGIEFYVTFYGFPYKQLPNTKELENE